MKRARLFIVEGKYSRAMIRQELMYVLAYSFDAAAKTAKVMMDEKAVENIKVLEDDGSLSQSANEGPDEWQPLQVTAVNSFHVQDGLQIP